MIIKDYILQANLWALEPFLKYELSVQPMIRNEMSDLEEWGFIIQPHTYQGVLFDKGYVCMGSNE